MSRSTRISIALALLAALVASGCGGQSGASDSKGGKLALVAYSTPQEAYEKIIPAFTKTSAGNGVGFTQSYGASGEQERAVEAGLPADVVALSLEPDVTKLVKKGLVASNWNADKYKGMVTDSIVVFAVRKGNPKHIKTWDDLVKPGVDVVSPNPFTSGGAKWNISAAYGAQIQQGKSPQQAQDYLGKLFKNVSVLDKSAREALSTFTSGKGDVLIAYENEAITAQQKGQDLDFVRPDQTILIENPAAVIEKSKEKAKAQAFVDFLRTDAAQKIYASKGYRTVVPALADKKTYPDP
ncbi:MAG: sulfate/thiosulfate transport system substrate-binding protein, partial [Frankiales bacterium]|nr:sulfate/thiosulfate transport system substrate-binding protein [Frankiales bacterium]